MEEHSLRAVLYSVYAVLCIVDNFSSCLPVTWAGRLIMQLIKIDIEAIKYIDGNIWDALLDNEPDVKPEQFILANMGVDYDS